MFGNETMPSWAGALLVLLPVLGGGAGWFLRYLDEKRKKSREEIKEDHNDDIERLEKLKDRIDADRIECREENKILASKLEAVRDQLLKVQLLAERAVAWIRHLETALDHKKVPFRRWDEDGSKHSDAAGSPPVPSSPGDKK